MDSPLIDWHRVAPFLAEVPIAPCGSGCLPAGVSSGCSFLSSMLPKSDRLRKAVKVGQLSTPMHKTLSAYAQQRPNMLAIRKQGEGAKRAITVRNETSWRTMELQGQIVNWALEKYRMDRHWRWGTSSSARTT